MAIDLTHVETSRSTIETNLVSSSTDLEKLNNLYGELNTFKKDLSDLLSTVRSHANTIDEKQQTAIINQMILVYGTTSTIIEFVHPLIVGDPQSTENLKRSQLITGAQSADSTANSIEMLCRTLHTNTTMTTLTNTINTQMVAQSTQINNTLLYAKQLDSQVKSINQSY